MSSIKKSSFHVEMVVCGLRTQLEQLQSVLDIIENTNNFEEASIPLTIKQIEKRLRNVRKFIEA